MGEDAPPFERGFFDTGRGLSRLGTGPIGGKAQGLVRASRILGSRPDLRASAAIELNIPSLAVITTNFFDAFLERNRLEEWVESDRPDDRLAQAFQRANLPAELVGDLRAVAEEVRRPLAVRSSSELEDALGRPFAGVYETKMVPGNQPDADSRFRSLTEAVKLVYASTFFRAARAYRRATGLAADREKMAVIIQEVVGRRHDGRFYPDVSGVARSYNFYPVGPARPEDGVVSLALGLGKTIVDGGVAWSYSPAFPRLEPPFGSPAEKLKRTQVEFWAVNMGPPPAYDPIAETEYLVKSSLAEAEADDTLRHVASTYDPRSQRIMPGVGRQGPRVVDFAPLLVLKEVPLNEQLQVLLRAAEESVGGSVEIEFAVVLEETAARLDAKLGFLQMRPLVVPEENVEVAPEMLQAEKIVAASESALGNGVLRSVSDVVFVEPERFERRETLRIARELEEMNRRLLAEERGYVLIGFGRWGSSDPWLGIPVTWGQIAGAKAIVESMLDELNVEPSQGSHFFHNLSSLRVYYFTVPKRRRPVDWNWLFEQEVIGRTEHVRHVRSKTPLVIKVDGRSRRGVILREE